MPALADTPNALDWSGLIRELIGRQLPAVPVTGNSLDGHETEMAKHNFQVVIKPVLPSKLLAMTGSSWGIPEPRCRSADARCIDRAQLAHNPELGPRKD
jgi:hypothetical protein